MAKTRQQIKTLVGYNTGRKDTPTAQLDFFCDDALKVAVNAHPFKDAQIERTFELNKGSNSFELLPSDNVVHIVTAKVIDPSGDTESVLVMKDRTWWDRNVSSSSFSGWPFYANRTGNTVKLDRPIDRNLNIKLTMSVEKTFANDSSECPIRLLDIFVVHYVTAMVFLSIQDDLSYNRWKMSALGAKWELGDVGGLLEQAIRADKFEPAMEVNAELYNRQSAMHLGLSVENMDSSHSDFGNIRSWY